VQVAKGYFDAEFPVAEPVMKDLATKFGMVLQTYCRICVQQCGDIANIHAGREAVRGQGLEGGLAAAGKFGGMIGGKAMEAAKQARLLAAGMIDEDGNQVGAGGELAGAAKADLFQWSGPDLVNLAVRFGTVQYMSDACQQLMQMIVDGAENQNYTGAPLGTVMDSTKDHLRQHGMMLANHIGANIVCVKLHAEFDALYVPYPTDSNIAPCLDGLDQTLDAVMPRIPPGYTKVVIEHILEKVLEVMLKHVIAWRGALGRQQTPLTAEDCDTVDSDLDEMYSYFTFGGEGDGLDEAEIAEKSQRLQRMVCGHFLPLILFGCRVSAARADHPVSFLRSVSFDMDCALCIVFLQWTDVSESARAHPRVLAASRVSTDGETGGGAAADGSIPEGIPGAPVSAEMAMEGAQKLGRFVTSTASMVGERATGAAGAAASGDMTAADAGEAAAAAAQAAADAAGEAAAAVSEKAKALGKTASNEFFLGTWLCCAFVSVWVCRSFSRLGMGRADTCSYHLPLCADCGRPFCKRFQGQYEVDERLQGWWVF
jgi:hypothetical protein